MEVIYENGKFYYFLFHQKQDNNALKVVKILEVSRRFKSIKRVKSVGSAVLQGAVIQGTKNRNRGDKKNKYQRPYISHGVFFVILVGTASLHLRIDTQFPSNLVFHRGIIEQDRGQTFSISYKFDNTERASRRYQARKSRRVAWLPGRWIKRFCFVLSLLTLNVYKPVPGNKILGVIPRDVHQIR